MPMQEGVGRHGYRVLALMFCLIGLVGLGTSLYAFRPSADLFDWLGFAFEAVSVACLFGLALTVIQTTIPKGAPRPAEAAPRMPAPQAAGVHAHHNPPLPPPPAEIPGAPPLQAAAGAPEGLQMPGAFQDETPAQALDAPARRRGNPLAREPKDNSAWLKERQTQKVDRHALAERYTRNTPEMRQILIGKGGWPAKPQTPTKENGWSADDPAPVEEAAVAQVGAGPAGPAAQAVAAVLAPKPVAPTVMARLAGPDDDPDWVPNGMGRGRCGGCDKIILAPQDRPIHLKCPSCNRVTLLQ